MKPQCCKCGGRLKSLFFNHIIPKTTKQTWAMIEGYGYCPKCKIVNVCKTEKVKKNTIKKWGRTY